MEDVDIIDLINNYQEKDLIIDKNNCNEIIFRYNHLGENDEIDSFYIKQNLEFKIKEMINKINKKIENGIVLSSDENQVLYNIYINKLSNKFPIYHNFIIKNHLLNKKIIPREIFKYVFKDFVETCMKEINDNTIKQYTPFCFIENLNKNIEEKKYVCGFLTNNSFDIYIDEKLVDMVYNGNYNGIETVFHELTHLKQHIEIKHNIVNGDIIKYIKEQILTKYSSTYYQENYKSISYEVDARIMGTFYTNKYLKTLGFTEKKEESDRIQNKLQKESIIRNEEKRKIGNTIMNLDDIFNLTISNKPELLEEYPQLKIEYIIEKNSVRKKNKSEIVKYIYENIDVINMDLLKYLSKNIEDSIYIDDTTLSEYISKR